MENLEKIINKPVCAKIRDITFLPFTYLIGSSSSSILGYNLPAYSENEQKLYATLGFAAGTILSSIIYEKLFMLIPEYREYVKKNS